MKYFYEYKKKNGAKVGGHNLEEIQQYKDIIILKGFDIILNAEYGCFYWEQKLDMNNIEYLTIRPMEEEK